ncbi:TIGR03620 family F420-dependent LLM class oxidoreductase [Nonomuraea typhae]|uniref:TIGR03620 family F420-dependent LLM class oxidoreductase n=1 Tax=Nonomuraea typhae TaxID=2603600 RepID=A0ABW7Z8X0_9ACTN
MDGRIGVWHPHLGRGPAELSRQAAVTLQSLGYGTLWVNEGPGSREPLAAAAILLAATSRIAIGTGIASIWARDATAMAAGAATLGEAFEGRFILGLGVSHGVLVENRGHTYAKPVSAMRAYLDQMDQTVIDVPAPSHPAPRLLAALRPKMLELSRDRAGGAHSYFVPPEHTANARAILGPDRLLVPEQAVVIEPDAAKARAIARAHMHHYLRLPNYVNNLKELGYTDDDLAGDGSDRLVDAIVAWGTEEAVVTRIRAHWDAGADHVALQPLSPNTPDLADAVTQLERLAPALGL